MEELDSDAPQDKGMQEVLAYITNCTKVFTRCADRIASIFVSGDGGAVKRVNLARVEQYRAGVSVTKPPTRQVVYEEEDEGNAVIVKLNDDLKMTAKPSLYRDGYMQYIVDWVNPEGPASEAHVFPRYRLVGISKRGGAVERFDFRKKDKFYDKGEAGYKGDPQAILKQLYEDEQLEVPRPIKTAGCVPFF
jgi:hypothetical protein